MPLRPRLCQPFGGAVSPLNGQRRLRDRVRRDRDAREHLDDPARRRRPPDDDAARLAAWTCRDFGANLFIDSRTDADLDTFFVRDDPRLNGVPPPGLRKAIIAEFPDYYRLYSEREFSYNGITQQNRNQLLWRDPSVDGMKTGHTSAAGYCIVTSASRDGMRLIAVVLGAESPRQRNDGAKKLLDYGFANYETRKLYSAGQQVEAAPVTGGEAEFAGVGPAADIFVTIPRGGYALLQASFDRLQNLVAPVAAGATVGSVNVSFDGRKLASTPLVVLSGVAEGGLWSRLRSSLK